MRRLLFTLSATCVFAASLGCALFPRTMRPEVVGVEPHIDSLDFKGVNLRFDVRTRNPYPFALKSPDLRCALTVQGHTFASQDHATRLDLPAERIGTIQVPLRLEYLDLARVFTKLGDAEEIDYTFRGALVTRAMGQSIELPFSRKGRFPVLKIPTVEVTDVTPDTFSWNQVAVDVSARLTNPNAFGLGLDGLGWTLHLGDTRIGSLNASSGGVIGARETGALSLNGELSTTRALIEILGGGDLDRLRLTPTGRIKTPYGDVRLPN